MVQTGPRKADEPPTHFVVELDPRGKSGLLIAAGVFSRREGGSLEDARGYAVSLIREFFRRKGNSLEVSDGDLVLQKIFHHLHRQVKERWTEVDPGLEAVVALARPDRVFVARCGGAQALLHREGTVSPAFINAERLPHPLGIGEGVEVEVEEVVIQPGDVLVLEDPLLAPLIRPRDLAVIMQRAGDLHRAGVFLAAIAERKGAEDPFTAILWEVPNLQGDASFFGEAEAAETSREQEAPTGQEVSPGEGEVAEGAEQVKRRWLDRFRRRQG